MHTHEQCAEGRDSLSPSEKTFSNPRPNRLEREVFHCGGKVLVFLSCPQLTKTKRYISRVSECKLGNCTGRRQIVRGLLRLNWQRRSVKKQNKKDTRMNWSCEIPQCQIWIFLVMSSKRKRTKVYKNMAHTV